MAFYAWNDSYAMGIPLIDRHHRMLVGYVNKLADALDHGAADKIVGELLNELGVYTQMHFSYEEALFNEHHYPDEVEHRHYHENLVGQVKAFLQRYQAGSDGLSVELLEFLKQWLNNHILREDMAYSGFLRERMGRKH